MTEQLAERKRVKAALSEILAQTLSGENPQYRTEDRRFIRWGRVERDVHKIIDGLTLAEVQKGSNA